jgi:4-alpha-glucanotransferase
MTPRSTPSPAGAPEVGTSAALSRLCDELGVKPAYESGGTLHRAPESTVVAALQALGAPIRTEEEAPDALRAVQSAKAACVLPPTTVSWMDESPSVVIRLPREATSGPVKLDVVTEDGERAGRIVTPDELDWSPFGGPGDRAVFEAAVSLPADLPAGYHEVSVRSAAGERGRTVVVRTPRTVWRPEEDEGTAGHASLQWGTFLPLHALRTGQGWGTGDIADLRALTRWTAETGGALVGTLPLYDTFLGDNDPFDPSPYAPVSRLFWNPLWIAMGEAPGLEGAPAAAALLETTDVLSRARRLRESRTVDYRGVMALKRSVLEAVAEAHRGDGPNGLGRVLTEWVREDPEALAYARFRAHTEATGEPWTGWPAPEASGDAGALAPPDTAVRYHVYAQWAVGQQLRTLAGEAEAPLYLDLPLASHPQGFDHWRDQERFARGFTVGAPPDAFYEGGQDWSFAPVHPERSREDGHAYWAACLRGAMEISGALRLDHVMALHRLYWIPQGSTAAEGVYVRYPAEELWAVLCLESRRARTAVIGEDLGTVPPEVPEAMERHGVAKMWVLPFEVATDGEPDGPKPYRVNPPAAGSMASLDTHDLPPFGAFYTGSDIEARVRMGLTDGATADAERRGREAWRCALVAFLRDSGFLDPEERAVAGRETADPEAASAVDAATALRATLEFLAGSSAGTVLVNLENLWLETHQQNLPGTPATENWIQRARLTLEGMTSDERVLDLVRLVDRGRRAALLEVPSPS